MHAEHLNLSHIERAKFMPAKRSNNTMRIVLELDSYNPSSPYLILAKSLPNSAIHDLLWIALCSIADIDSLDRTAPKKPLFVFRRVSSTTCRDRKGFISTVQLLNFIQDFSPSVIGYLFKLGSDLMDPLYLYEIFDIDPKNPKIAHDYEELDNLRGEASRSSLLESLIYKKFGSERQTRKQKGLKPNTLLNKMNSARHQYKRSVTEDQKIELEYVTQPSESDLNDQNATKAQTLSTPPIKSGIIKYSERDTDNGQAPSKAILDPVDADAINVEEKRDVARREDNEPKALPSREDNEGDSSTANSKRGNTTPSQQSDPSLDFMNNLFNDSI